MGLQGHPRLKGHRLKGEQTALDQLAQIHLSGMGGQPGAVRLGQEQQVLHQSLHLPCLLLGVAQPLGLAVHRVRRVGQHNAGIGQDHRKRRFQLMGGVGDELALLLPGLFHRPEGQGGQKQTDEEKGGHGQQPDEQAGEEEGAQSAALPGQIGKGDADGAVRLLLHQKAQAQVGQHAAVLFRVHSLLGGLGGGLLRHVHMAAVVDGHHRSILHGDGKDGDHRGIGVPVAVLLLRRRADLKPGRQLVVPPVQRHMEGGGALVGQPPGVGGEQQDKDHRQHQPHQQQVDEDEFPPQPPDHDAGTSR